MIEPEDWERNDKVVIKDGVDLFPCINLEREKPLMACDRHMSHPHVAIKIVISRDTSAKV